MKILRALSLSLIIFGAVFQSVSYGQCDPIANVCDKHLGNEFISDGQSYRALLRGDEVAEFRTTFFAGSVYRLAACSDTTGGNLIFRVYDQERNLLFTNEDHKVAPYWDFKVPSTMDCIIEAKLDPNVASSGCAVLLIGFKE